MTSVGTSRIVACYCWLVASCFCCCLAVVAMHAQPLWYRRCMDHEHKRVSIRWLSSVSGNFESCVHVCVFCINRTKQDLASDDALLLIKLNVGIHEICKEVPVQCCLAEATADCAVTAAVPVAANQTVFFQAQTFERLQMMPSQKVGAKKKQWHPWNNFGEMFLWSQTKPVFNVTFLSHKKRWHRRCWS